MKTVSELEMKSTVLIIAIVFTSCVLFEAKCDSNYEHEKQLRKRGAGDEKTNDPSKEMFMKRDKRHAEEHEKTMKGKQQEEETRAKRDAADQMKEGFQNFKEKAQEGMDKMKQMFEANIPKTKRHAVDKDEKEGADKCEDEKSGLDRKKRDASSLIASSIDDGSPRGKRLVHYDVRESYETRYSFE